MSQPRTIWRLAAIAIVTLAVATASVGAQEEPSPDDLLARVAALTGAFQAVADRAGEGRWQDADEAFNRALEALDQHQGIIEGARGDAARIRFRRVEQRMAELVTALDAEDVARTSAAAAAIRSEIDALAPGAAPTARAVAEAEVVLRWRTMLDQVRILGAAAAWRDMRNAAIALREDVQETGPRVAAAGGPPAALAVDRVRVFASRLIAAAQNQSPTDAEAGLAVGTEATTELLQILGVLPTPVPTAAPDVRMRFRVHDVTALPGQPVVVPVGVEDAPRIGLGSFDLVLQWSPAALRLTDVSWAVAQGSVLRNDLAGTARLSLPPGPTGPSGDAVLARLTFEPLDAPPVADDYLPSDETSAISDAITDAREAVRAGDLPRAAGRLETAYLSFQDGRSTPGGLGARLESVGLADPLAADLLAAMEAASTGAASDVVLVLLSSASARLAAAGALYLRALAPDGGVPVVLDVRSAADTTGAALPSLPGQAGHVRVLGAPPSGASAPAVVTPGGLPEGVGGVGTATAPSGAGGPPDDGVGAAGATTASPDGRAGTASADVRAGTAGPTPVAGEPGGPSGGGGRRFPIALVVALGGAVALGAIALLLGDRGEEEQSP